MHPIVSSIRSLLDEQGVPYSFMEHAAGTTSEEMAVIRKDYSLSEGAKALILSTDVGFVQVVVPGDTKFKNSKLRAVLQTKNIRFATREELADITDGILPGAVPPFGTLFNLTVYADQKLFANERIVFNCGERTASIAMQSDDYRSVIRPTVVDISC
ncbi:MAG: hypothetical protein OXB96_00315 [Candidatus Kaiserbacteria bacterium]|nr:hypothetical protein [Candidatus Kaiserbacteria bacterium]